MKPGASFLKAPEIFWACKAIAKSQTLRLQSCFIYTYTSPFLDTGELKLALQAQTISRNGPLETKKKRKNQTFYTKKELDHNIPRMALYSWLLLMLNHDSSGSGLMFACVKWIKNRHLSKKITNFVTSLDIQAGPCYKLNFAKFIFRF